MKTKLLLSVLFALGIQQAASAQTDANGYTTVNMTMGASYQNRVFYDISANSMVSQPANTWDIAFYRNSGMSFGTRINDAQNVEVYQASDNPNDWNSITTNAVSAYGAPLYNRDNTTSIQQGAFEQGTAAYGWGEYNPGNHHVEGKVIFILKYPSDVFYKFMIDDYFGGYTFKYAKWNASTSSWDATVSKTIANGTDDAYFNYFSFTTGEKVPSLEPSRTGWDLMFTRYWTDYAYTDPNTGQPATMKYRMAGVLQNSNITVAKVQPETQATATATLPASAAFSNSITTIGHSWKPAMGAPYSNVVYYVKQGSEYYRMYFTSNEGSSNGNMYFKYKNISSVLDVTDIAGRKASFGIYPNPVTADRKATVLFEVKEKLNSKGNVEVYDFSGKKVYSAELTNQTGFYRQDLDLTQLASGNYLVKISFGGQTETKKLIVK